MRKVYLIFVNKSTVPTGVLEKLDKELREKGLDVTLVESDMPSTRITETLVFETGEE